MNINDVVNIVRRVHDAEGWDLSTDDRDYTNRFWARAIGIVHHGHPLYNPTPDKQWHIKKASATRPQTNDVVVKMPSREFWDCIPGVGAPRYRFAATYHGRLGDEQIVYPPLMPEGGGVTEPQPNPSPNPEPQPNPEPPPLSVMPLLAPDQALKPGESLHSGNGRFILTYQSDGNLVLYDTHIHIPGTSDALPIWASQTGGSQAGQVVMQGDGNCVMYDATGAPIWDTAHGVGTTHGHELVAGSSLVLQDDGNLVLYTPEGLAIWASQTGGHEPVLPPFQGAVMTLVKDQRGRPAVGVLVSQVVGGNVVDQRLSDGGGFTHMDYQAGSVHRFELAGFDILEVELLPSDTPHEVRLTKPGVPNVHPFPLGPGILRARGNGYYINGRPTHALGCMAGDLALCHSEGVNVDEPLDDMMRAGFHYVGPTWDPLVRTKGSGGPFWDGRALSPLVNGYDWWYEVTRDFARKIIDRGMKVFLANGGLHLFTNEEETQIYHGLKNLQSELGTDNFFMTGYVNEPRDTGDADDRDPREIERLVNIIRAMHPDNQYGLGSYTGDTPPEDVARWTTAWMDSWCTYHGFRGGHYWDKLRHLQNHHYESFTNIRPCFVNDEDFGPQGRYGHLSVQQNDHELDKHVMLLAISIAMQGRCAYSYTCSSGIKYHADDPFRDFPGFMEGPRFANLCVPPDIGSYEHLVHSGDTKDQYRVFRAQGGLRVDGRVRSDGHFYMTGYAPPQEATSEIVLDKSAEFDLINTNEEVFHFSLGEGQRIPAVPVEKGYVLRGRIR